MEKELEQFGNEWDITVVRGRAIAYAYTNIDPEEFIAFCQSHRQIAEWEWRRDDDGDKYEIMVSWDALAAQLTTMVEFMSNTPDPDHDEMWWAGDVPFADNPGAYAPELVAGDGDRPIVVIWYDYILDLAVAGETNEAMQKYLLEVPQVHAAIGDLLEASMSHANDYWRGAIRLWEAQYKKDFLE